MLEYSRFMRRCKNLIPIFQSIRSGLIEMSSYGDIAIIDSFPLPLCQDHRKFRAILFQCFADIGYNATKQKYYYGFVEGMLSKCLVVASDSGASGEIIQDGVTGRLYRNDSVDSLTETILKAINDLYIDNGIPDAAQTFAIKNFSEQLNTENIIKLYKQII